MSRLGETLMNFGSWFHNFGVEYLKGNATKVCYLTFGECIMVPVLLVSILSCVLLLMLIRSCKDFGTILAMHLNIVIRTLCSILCCMGSQCSFFSAHDEPEYLLLFRISLHRCFVWSGIFLGWLMADHWTLHWHNWGKWCRASVLVWYRIELLDTYLLHEVLLCWPLLFCFLFNVFLKFRCWSRNPQRYLTTSITAIGSPWASGGSDDVFWAAVGSQLGCNLPLWGFNFRCIVSIQCLSCVNVSSRSVLLFYFDACFKVFAYGEVISKCSKCNGDIDLILNKWAVAGEKIGMDTQCLRYPIFELPSVWVFAIYCYLEGFWLEIVFKLVECCALDSEVAMEYH